MQCAPPVLSQESLIPPCCATPQSVTTTVKPVWLALHPMMQSFAEFPGHVPHCVSPVLHAAQAPLTQSPLGQTLPHPLQFFASLAGFTHTPLQSFGAVLGQTHDVPEQVPPDGHVTQTPPQFVCPFVQTH